MHACMVIGISSMWQLMHAMDMHKCGSKSRARHTGCSALPMFSCHRSLYLDGMMCDGAVIFALSHHLCAHGRWVELERIQTVSSMHILECLVLNPAGSGKQSLQGSSPTRTTVAHLHKQHGNNKLIALLLNMLRWESSEDTA